MAIFKRVFLFIATNIAVMAMVTIVIQVLGIGPSMDAYGVNYGNLYVNLPSVGYGRFIYITYDVKEYGLLVLWV